MKKILLTITLFIIYNSNSQVITVNTNTYTVPQLVNNILINSPCVSGTNITWRTGTNYGSTNGIGYFQNTNPNFPMQSGVILTTGDVMHAPGPNLTTLSDGSAAWPGDSDLEATLAQAGITMVSKNASVLEFDFTPISPTFSFDFIFASEEYGNFQCQFSDAFSFLLTNMNTGVTTNLAVVPNTTTPISVVTIRDFLYNSTCGSVNPQYFGSFNGGSSASASATNYNGQTKVMTASSVLVPNTPYHIKLVIADRNDPLSDSAIFLSATSFNIGQAVLGQDLTVQDGSAICYGQTHTLSTGLSASQYTFSWTKDGVAIAGETSPNLTVSEAGTYSVTYFDTSHPCQPITDTINVEYYPEMVVQSPKNIYKCNTGASSYSYDLTTNTSIVMAGLDPSYQIAYFNSLSNASNNSSPLSSPYSSSGNETIYVKVTNPATGCYAIKTFDLQLVAPPVAYKPLDLKICERTITIHDATFNLAQQNPSVLNGQDPSIYVVSYYTSLANANAGLNPIQLPSFIGTNGTVIYVRVQNATDSSCYSTNSFNLIVNPLPPIDTIQNVVVCDNYTLTPLTNGNYFTAPNGGGTPLFAGNQILLTQTVYIYATNGSCKSESSFQVKIINLNNLDPGDGTYCGSYTLPSSDYASYYTQPNAGGTLLHSGDVITSSQDIYLYYQSLLPPFCVAELSFHVNIIPSQSVAHVPNVFSCDSYVLPPLAVGNYYTASGGTGTQIPAGTAITSTQTIYTYYETTTTPKCTSEDSFTVFIGLNTMNDITECVSYTLPVLPVGNYYTGPNGTGTMLNAGDVITSTQNIYVYAVSNSGCVGQISFNISISLPFINLDSMVFSCGNYTLPNLANGNYYTGSNGTGTTLNAGDQITQTQTVYVFIDNGMGCQNEIPLNITINQVPEIDPRADNDVCGSYTLTQLTVGNYYTGPGGTGDLLPAGTVLTSTQKIYIYAASNSTPPCISENSFTIHIYHTYADSPANVVACDSYVLPALTSSNKYYTQPNGPNGTGTEILPGTTITTSQTIYVYIQTLIRDSFYCSDEKSFTVTINHTPIVPPVANVNACNNYTLPTISVGDYYNQSGKTGTLLHAGDVITTNQTLYIYAETGTTPNCFDEKSFSINLFNVDQLPNVTTCSSYTLPALTIGKYYTGSQGTGTLLHVGNSITSSQTIYIYSQSPFSQVCYDETSFNVTIVPQPIANTVPLANRTLCDTDGTNDGITLFDLTTLNSFVLGTQTGSEFSIAYYATQADANTNANPISAPTTLQSVYVRVNNALAPNCFDVKNIQIIVHKLPEPTPKDGIICVDNITGSVTNPFTILSGLSATTNTFVWTNQSGAVVGTGNSLFVTAPGVYTVVATNISTGCSSLPVQSTVIQSQPAIVSYTTSDDFSENQSITVEATGSGGDYEYQLDNGPFQDSPVFENANFGSHFITVRDKYGCGVTTVKALLVNYPKFFTPNGDGINDTWNIIGLQDQHNARIYIYDRYGKLMKEFAPNDRGWDGFYNGQMVFADDYWFTVNYTEKDESKEFRAHFALKR